MEIYAKQCNEYDHYIKTNGICVINTNSGEVVHSESFVPETEEILNSSLNSGKLQDFNSQFNSIFYRRGFPSIIRIKHEKFSEFVKFLDVDHILYFVQENSSINYPKIKLQLSKIAA